MQVLCITAARVGLVFYVRAICMILIGNKKRANKFPLLQYKAKVTAQSAQIKDKVAFVLIVAATV